MPKVLSTAKLNTVLAKLDAGVSHEQIASTTGVSMGHISKLRRIHRPNLPRSLGGRPCKVTPASTRHLVRLVANGNSCTAVQASRQLRALTGDVLSPGTVRRTLRDAGLKSKHKVKKPNLPKHIRDARLKFARAHRHWTVEDWKRVMWSDETKINRLGSDGQQWVWVRPGQELSDAAIAPTGHSGGGSLIIWGCFMWEGQGYATKIEDTMTKEVYVEILEDEMMKSLEYYGKEVGDIIFQQDNAPAHNAHLSMNWLHDHGFEVLEWPSRSPDLNPIENLWSHVKRKLGEYEHPAKGMLELWERVQVEWEKIEPRVCENLIKSMPNRMKEVIAKKGAVINY